MAKPHLSRVGELDPCSTRIDFPPQVRSAFRDLAVAVHHSEHFDPLILQTVQEWADTRKPSVEDVVTSLPVIASQTFEHIQETGDKLARQAWSDISGELLEHGFTMQKDRWKGK